MMPRREMAPQRPRPATASRRDRRFLIAAFDAARAAYPDDVGDQRLVHERDAQPSRRHTTFN
jgi:hypothetical protein